VKELKELDVAGSATLKREAGAGAV
jgi:hypothetical protein